MSIDTSSYYDLLTSSSSTSTTTDSSSSLSLDAADFLTLLVTEIEYQDPTEPLETAEMFSQMTQFSQLDQLTDLNDKMDDLVDSIGSMTATSGLDYLGKEVEADGSTLSVSDGSASTIYYELEDDASSVVVNIYDSDGSIVATQELGQQDAGSYALVWDATDSDGETVSDGVYTALFSATDAEDADVDVSTTTTGTVSGVSNTDDGVVLILDDGRTVNMLDVTLATS